MEKRTKKITLRLSETEFQKLNDDVAKTTLSREKYLRQLIEDKKIPLRPNEHLLEAVRILNSVKFSMAALAYAATKQNYIDADTYWNNFKTVEGLQGKLLEEMFDENGWV